MENEELSDKALFESAVSNEPAPQPAPEATQPEVQAQEAVNEQPRDEHGRFAPKVEKTEEAAPVVQAQVAEQSKPEPDAMVPSWRLREVREEAERRAKEDREKLESDFQARLRQFQTQAQPQQPQQPPPNLFEAPDERLAFERQQFSQQMQSQRFEFSEMLARQTIGDQKVEQAVKWLEGNLNPALQARIVNSRHPWGEVVKAHEESRVLAEIGPDPAAYRARLEEQLLNDPAFMQKVGEKLRSQSQTPQPNGQRPAPVTQLPPSLQKVGSSVSHTAGLTDADMSDAALFNYARA